MERLDVGDDLRRGSLLQIHGGGSALLLALAATALVYGWYRWVRHGDMVAVVLRTVLADVRLHSRVFHHDAGDADRVTYRLAEQHRARPAVSWCLRRRP